MRERGKGDVMGEGREVSAAASAGWRRLAAAGAIATYLLVVLGGIVRITGSGMGCGDDWPLCNGELIPPMDLPTLIEYGHRLAAAGVGLLVVSLAAWAALRARSDPAWRGNRRVGYVAVALLVVQVLLGAVTVRWELPPATVILHLGTGMALLGALIVAAARGWKPERAGRRVGDGAARLAAAGAVLALAVVLAGALVANLNAAPACQGFPLCNGSWLPRVDNWRVHVHWAHRLLAYALVGWALALPALTRRWRPRDRAARGWAWAGALAALVQLGIAAAMVLLFLPAGLRTAHVAAGAAVFAALVLHAWWVAHPAEVGTAEAAGGRAMRSAGSGVARAAESEATRTAGSGTAATAP